MKTLAQFNRTNARIAESTMRAGITSSRWFKSAPEEVRKRAVIRIVGVEQREFALTMGGVPAGKTTRPVLVAECTLEPETRTFDLPLRDIVAHEVTMRN